MKSKKHHKKQPGNTNTTETACDNQLNLVRLQLSNTARELAALKESKEVRELMIKEQLVVACSKLMEAIAKIVSPGTF